MHKKAASANIHHHNHGHKHPVNEKNLLVATLLNLVITAAEFAGGIISNSLALMSDALHNLSDTFATLIAYLATKISRRDANLKKTFGYKRIEILAAMLNAVILIVICIFLFKEAYHRWNDPQPINSMVMLVVAMIGLLANLFAVILLRKDAGKSINVKAAYVHLIGDSLSSVVVIIGGVLIQIFELYWIDPVITVLIGLYIIKEAFVILKEAVDILMHTTPVSVDINLLKQNVESHPDISNIHHLHVWSLTDQEIHLEAHIELARDRKLSEIKSIQHELEEILKSSYSIHHITIQFEYKSDHPPHLVVTDE